MKILQERKVKAKKDHICNYCGHKIAAGEQYYYSFIVNGADGYAWKAHKNCDKIANGYFEKYNYNEISDNKFNDIVRTLLYNNGIINAFLLDFRNCMTLINDLINRGVIVWEL